MVTLTFDTTTLAERITSRLQEVGQSKVLPAVAKREIEFIETRTEEGKNSDGTAAPLYSPAWKKRREKRGLTVTKRTLRFDDIMMPSLHTNDTLFGVEVTVAESQKAKAVGNMRYMKFLASDASDMPALREAAINALKESWT